MNKNLLYLNGIEIISPSSQVNLSPYVPWSGGRGIFVVNGFSRTGGAAIVLVFVPGESYITGDFNVFDDEGNLIIIDANGSYNYSFNFPPGGLRIDFSIAADDSLTCNSLLLAQAIPN